MQFEFLGGRSHIVATRRKRNTRSCLFLPILLIEWLMCYIVKWGRVQSQEQKNISRLEPFSRIYLRM